MVDSSFTVSDSIRRAQEMLVTQASDFSLETIASMVDQKAIDPNPDYQRRKRWNTIKQSALIESFLLSLPVPPVYLAEEKSGYYSVIDGKQRITAIHEFMRGNLQLTGLKELAELNGKRVGDLDIDSVNALRMRPYIRAVTLLKQSNPELKYEVFIRLNRGGESLTAQEVRNVAARGVLNDTLIELASNPFLREQFNIDESSERYRQMADVEYVLRFVTLAESYPRFSGDLAGAMDAFMRVHRDSAEMAAKAKQTFEQAIQRCHSIFDTLAFRRPEAGNWRGRGLLGMYDAEMVAVSLLSAKEFERARENSEGVRASLLRLGDDRSFLQSVTEATNTPARINTRINRVLEAIRAA